MEIKRPRSRDRGEATEGKGVFKRGEGTGQGPVGTGQGPKVDKAAEDALRKKAEKEYQESAKRVDRSRDNEPVQRSSDRGMDLGDILGALGSAMAQGGSNGQGGQNPQGGYGGQQGMYNNLTPQQQAQLQQQILQEMQAQQQAQQAQQQAYAQQQAQQQAYAQQQAQQQAYAQQQYGKPKKKSRGGIIFLILALLVFFLVFKMMSGGNNSGTSNTGTTNNSGQGSGTSSENSSGTNAGTNSNSGSSTSSNSGTTSSNTSGSYGFGGTGGNSLFATTGTSGASVAAGSGYSSGWQLTSNNGNYNTNVSSEAREKFTSILGNGQDEMTILVYMCGTDLESNYAMASRDLQEMLAATRSDKVKIVLFTGGCLKWQNDVMSNSVNQIYDINTQGLRRINDNAGNSPMVDPNTLESFVKWGAQNYPANRMALIFWDHGGGSVSGYGYDQRYQRNGSMSLTQINQALSNAGVKFDFIGFDACLMATAETALMASNYADYLIASEEVEPGIGWYYTNWLTNLCANTSMDTLELGKQIIDDYTARCQKECPGQATTLSIVDLAEIQNTLPKKLTAFANETSSLIESGSYQTIAKARSSSQEFSRQSKIDQIDLAHFANLTGTASGKDLVQTLVNAVKYNRTSKAMTNAYGLSIYFPYRNLAYVDVMSKAYSVLGIDASMSKCISKFAKMQVSGQASSGGSSSPLWSLINSDGNGGWASGSNYGSGYGSGSSSGSYGGTISSSDLEALLGQLFGGTASSYDSYGLFGLGRSNAAFMTEDDMDVKTVATYLSENMMNAEDFVWKENSEGYASIQLSDEQWDKITTVEMSMFYDDGEGYIDLGLDTIFDVDKDGNMLPVVDDSWISIDDQPVAYYHLSTYESEDGSEYTITGRVPVMYNEQRADLILVFDQDNPSGYIAGVRYTYQDNEDMEVVAKAQESLVAGDKIDFLCDYYGYDGSFQDSYYLGEQYTVGEDPSAIKIGNTIVGDSVLVTYKFMDIFGETYWTPAL